MARFFSLEVFFAVCTTLAASANAVECSPIKQDKARLKCYDDREKIVVEQAQASTAADQLLKDQQSAEFKRLASSFVRDTQANLTLAALQWQNFMDNPGSKPVSVVLESNRKIQGDVASLFVALMAAPGKENPISEKLKDYYAAWGLAFSSIRPTSSDSGRTFAIRMNSELNRMSALAERLMMDI
jgi:hypothetical protein